MPKDDAYITLSDETTKNESSSDGLSALCKECITAGAVVSSFFHFINREGIMKRFLFCFLFVLSGCLGVTVSDNFEYKEITTSQFRLASWQKITNDNAACRIYIEGDGYAFNAKGLPSQNPTPHGFLVRDLSFNDPAENVIYLARPCQYLQDNRCNAEYWTVKRFSSEVVEAEYEAVKQICKNKPITLIGFSGGAQIAGLIAVKYPDLKINKVITIAGNLNHKAWTYYHHLPELSGSLDLSDYKEKFALIPQVHFVGKNDRVIPSMLSKRNVSEDKIIEVENATHDKGWHKIYSDIYNQ